MNAHARPLFALCLACAPLLAAACSSGAPAAASKRPPPMVAVAKVEARDVPVTVNAPVDLRPLAVSDVGAKALGYLDAVLVDRGDQVKRGQLLAVVRPSDLPDQLEAERASLGAFQASLALARTNFERASSLAPKGLVSQQELQQATSSVASAEAAEAASKARIEAMATRLGETRIFSPVDGVVLQRKLDPGALVGPGGSGAILTVAQVQTLRVFVSVNEREAPRVRLGQLAKVELDAFPGRTFEGKVVRMSPAFDANTRTLDAEVQLANESGELRIGMYGRAAIILDVHQGATVVPVSAVTINALGRYAFVLDGDKARRRAVKTGVDGGEWLEILEGVSPGESIVTAGADALSDGATVRLPGTKPGGPPGPGGPGGPGGPAAPGAPPAGPKSEKSPESARN
ncbi:MAG: efflux RND transporter periplasmic adaptor subunit [Myxococcales bacterium]